MDQHLIQNSTMSILKAAAVSFCDHRFTPKILFTVTTHHETFGVLLLQNSHFLVRSFCCWLNTEYNKECEAGVPYAPTFLLNFATLNSGHL